MAIYDTMQWVSCDVATYCIGQCASMGSLLLAAGAKGKRNALPHSRIMIHQPLAGMEGTATEIMIHAEEFIRMKKQLNQIYQKHTGQTLERLQEDTDRDRFMSPEEAREYGLIDNVVDREPADFPAQSGTCLDGRTVSIAHGRSRRAVEINLVTIGFSGSPALPASAHWPRETEARELLGGDPRESRSAAGSAWGSAGAQSWK